MAKTVIRAEGAPPAVGPYVHGIRTDDLVFTSGQVGLDPATRSLVDGGVGPQTRRAIENLQAILAAAACSLADVVKTTVFLTSMDHFQAMNAVYAESFGDTLPARTTVAVVSLPLGALVEIEAIAARPR